MFDDMSQNPAVAKVLNMGGDWGREIKYMCCHGFLCYCAFFLGPLLWHSFILHSAYLIAIVGISVYNGGTFYFRVFAKKYYGEQMKEAAIEVESELEEHDLAIVIPSSPALYDAQSMNIAGHSNIYPVILRQEQEFPEEDV